MSDLRKSQNNLSPISSADIFWLTAIWPAMDDPWAPGMDRDPVQYGYPSQTHHELKFHKNSTSYNLFLSRPIILNFCTEHGSDTAVLCAKFQNDWTTCRVVVEEWDFAKNEIKRSFRGISVIAMGLKIVIGLALYPTSRYLGNDDKDIHDYTCDIKVWINRSILYG